MTRVLVVAALLPLGCLGALLPHPLNLVIRPAGRSRSYKWLGPGDPYAAPLHIPRPPFIPRWLPGPPEYMARWVPTTPSPHSQSHHSHSHSQSVNSLIGFGAPKSTSVVSSYNSVPLPHTSPRIVSSASSVPNPVPAPAPAQAAPPVNSGYSAPHPDDIITGSAIPATAIRNLAPQSSAPTPVLVLQDSVPVASLTRQHPVVTLLETAPKVTPTTSDASLTSSGKALTQPASPQTHSVLPLSQPKSDPLPLSQHGSDTLPTFPPMDNSRVSFTSPSTSASTPHSSVSLTDLSLSTTGSSHSSSVSPTVFSPTRKPSSLQFSSANIDHSLSPSSFFLAEDETPLQQLLINDDFLPSPEFNAKEFMKTIQPPKFTGPQEDLSQNIASIDLANEFNFGTVDLNNDYDSELFIVGDTPNFDSSFPEADIIIGEPGFASKPASLLNKVNFFVEPSIIVETNLGNEPTLFVESSSEDDQVDETFVIDDPSSQENFALDDSSFESSIANELSFESQVEHESDIEPSPSDSLLLSRIASLHDPQISSFSSLTPRSLSSHPPSTFIPHPLAIPVGPLGSLTLDFPQENMESQRQARWLARDEGKQRDSLRRQGNQYARVPFGARLYSRFNRRYQAWPAIFG